MSDRHSRNPATQKRFTEMEEKFVALKDEMAGVYKTSGMNAQKVLDLSEELRRKEEVLILKDAELI